MSQVIAPSAAAPADRSATARPRWRPAALALGWLALLAPFVFDAVAVVRASDAWLVRRLPDDAFYYLEVARRIGHGEGFTFDGIHATNGFHPLWQLMLAGLGLGFTSQDGFIRATMLLALACSLGAVLLLVRLVWRRWGAGPALVGGVIAVHSRTLVLNLADGMEGAIVVLVVAVLATALVWWADRPSGRRAAVVGVVSALAVFARLDLVVVIWLVPVAMAWRLRDARAGAQWLLGAAVGAPFAVWFVARYHHVLTVSATIKQHSVSAMIDHQYGGHFTASYVDYVDRLVSTHLRELLAPPNATVLSATALGLVTGLVVSALALVPTLRWAHAWYESRKDRRLRAARAPRTPEGWALAWMALILAAKELFDIINAPLWADDWYNAPQRVAMAFAVGAAAWIGARWLLARHRPVGLVAVGYLLFAAIPLGLSLTWVTASATASPYSWQDELDAAASWVHTHGPPGRYGARDAGLLGYRLDGERPLVNLDGLVNNYEFADRVNRDASLTDLAAMDGVDYYVGRLEDGNHELGCGRVLWSSPGKSISSSGYGDRAAFGRVYVIDLRTCGAGR